MASSGSNEKNMQLMQGLELPPLRNFHEFLLETDRYERPPVRDLRRWNNRIISNLLYFQTNYFAIVVVLFLLQTFIYGKYVAIGIIAIASIVATVIYVVSAERQIKQFRTDYPKVTCVVGMTFIYGFSVTFPYVLVTIFAILFPVLIILIHASLRLRGIANRAANLTERYTFPGDLSPCWKRARSDKMSWNSPHFDGKDLGTNWSESVRLM